MDLQIDDFELIVLEASPVAARLQVRTRVTCADGSNVEYFNLRLAGSITGPYCDEAHTLPATLRLVDESSEGQLQATAVVPDPCFWTTELPYLYRVELHVVQNGEIRHRQEELVGIRTSRTSAK